MERNAHDCIEFDGFTLNPKDRLLFKKKRRINLDGKGFDILVYLAKRPNVFLTNQDLLNGVWKTDAFVEESNVTTYISKIRDALGDNDLKNPKYIETVHGHKGYRFIARKVLGVPCNSEEFLTDFQPVKTEGSFQIESHKFVPIFLDSDCYEQIQSDPQQTIWAEHKQILKDEGTINILPTGVGVWHIREALAFTTLTDLAIWRLKTYHEIIEERHAICNRTQEILSTLAPNKKDPFYVFRGKPGYVLSLMVLGSALWEAPQEFRNALKLLCCLTPLQVKDSDAEVRDQAIRLETEFLKSECHFPDIVEFGLSGNNIGFASWAGVSYHELSDQRYSLQDRIVEFEIAVQGLWWFASCIKETCLSINSKSKSRLKEQIDVMIRQFAKLKNIGATEPTPQRTMCEAILATSRLENLLDDTVKLYNQL
ncbi:MAG: transcriptional regulator [Pyrinomonadaceae bacterium]